jgi:murein DD-endopeptidase MepM/ murein hydrolase activator NlpD
VEWEGRPIPAWREAPGAPLRALLGVDLEHLEGASTLSVTAPDLPPCSVSVAVRAGDFVVRRLQVPKRYVELSPGDQARAETEAAQLEAVFSVVTDERLWDGAFRLPLAGTAPSDNFGQRRILNGEPRSPHAGVDFSVPTGTPIRATARGRVVLAATLFFAGRTVVLDHGLGLFSFYGHMSELAVSTGDVVAAGARLGLVGATGRATGPHLHWSVRLNGARVNPLRLVDVSSGRTRRD